MANNLEAIGNRLRSERKARGLTQSDLAKEIGVHKNTLAYWEIGHCAPSAQNKRVLIDFFDLPENFFFDPHTDFERKVLDELATIRRLLEGRTGERGR